MSKSEKNSIIVVVYPDQGEGTDPEALGIAFHHQYAYCQAATNLARQRWRAMICFSQGDALRVLCLVLKTQEIKWMHSLYLADLIFLIPCLCRIKCY